MNTVIDYSVYQGCYDALNSGNALPETSEEFGNILKGRIADVLNSYGSVYEFQDRYVVYLPRYSDTDIIRVDGSDSKINVMVTDREIYTEEPAGMRDEIFLKKKLRLGGEFDIDCFGVYDEAVNRNNTVSIALKQKIEEKIDGDNGLVTGRSVSNINECNGIVDVVESEIKTEFEEANPDVDVKDIDFNLEFDRGVNNKCYFTKNRASTATALVTIQNDSGKTYPVWNGTELSFEPLKAVFSLTVNY